MAATGLASLALAAAAAAAGPAPQGRQALVHQGLERAYVLRLPGTPVPAGQRLPLVLVLHGGGGHAENAEAMTGFTAVARREGFIVVYPEGTGRLKAGCSRGTRATAVAAPWSSASMTWASSAR